MTRLSSPAYDHEAQADLARLKALAEEGRNRPLLGGRDSVLFGLAVTLASILHAAILANVLPWPQLALAGVWFVSIGGAALVARLLRNPTTGNTAVGNRVERAVWRASALVLTVLPIGIFAHAALNDGDGYRLFSLMPPITFGVYAIALTASATAARADYLKPYAALSLFFMAITLLLSSSIWQYAAMSVGAVIVGVLPGIAQMRRVRADG